MRIILATVFTLAASVAANAADYGKPIDTQLAPVPIAQAVANAEKYATGVHAFSGRIGQVCQTKGCWITLTEDDVMARVMTGDQFFVPKDSSGTAVVVGTLSQKTLSAKAAAHFTGDAGKGATALAEQSTEWRVTATSIQIE